VSRSTFNRSKTHGISCARSALRSAIPQLRHTLRRFSRSAACPKPQQHRWRMEVGVIARSSARVPAAGWDNPRSVPFGQHALWLGRFQLLRSAGFPACGFRRLSSRLFREDETRDKNVPQTRRQECLRYIKVGTAQGGSQAEADPHARAAVAASPPRRRKPSSPHQTLPPPQSGLARHLKTGTLVMSLCDSHKQPDTKTCVKHS
jgi:hypothetical protein